MCVCVCLAEQFEETRLAVWFVVLLFETSFAQRFQTEVANQVMRVELGAHGGDASAHDGLLARLAHAAPGLVVVNLTQWLTLVLEEAAVHERAETLLQGVTEVNMRNPEP